MEELWPIMQDCFLSLFKIAWYHRHMNKLTSARNQSSGKNVSVLELKHSMNVIFGIDMELNKLVCGQSLNFVD